MTVVSEHKDRVVREDGDRFIKEFSTRAALEREVGNYRKLADAGVPGPEILSTEDATLITRRLPAEPLDDVIRTRWSTMPRRERNALIKRVALSCRRIRDAGLDWPDLVTYHLYIGADEIYVLDPDRLRPGSLDLSALFWSTEEPTVTRSERLRFWRAYAGADTPPRLRRIGHRGRFRPYRWVLQRTEIRACPPWSSFVKAVELPYASADEIAHHADLEILRRMASRTNARLHGLFVKVTTDPAEAQAEWENHRKLMAAGFRVPQPAAGGLLRDGRGLFATVALEGYRPVNQIWDTFARREIVRAVLDLTWRFHQCGFVHRDLYLNHFFARPGDTDLVLIDLARMKTTRRARWRRKDLAALLMSGRRKGRVTRTDVLRGSRRFRLHRYDAWLIHRKARRMARHVPRNIKDGTHLAHARRDHRGTL